MVFPSTPGVSVRVLRPMFVPGCGGPHEFVNSVSFSHFLCAVTPTPLCFSFTTSLLDHPLSCYLCFLTSPSHSPLPFSPFFLLFPSFSPCSPPPQLSSLPRRSHGSLVVRLLEGIPTPPPPPLEPLSFSLFALCLARYFFFSSSLSTLSLFFSSSLFNVEVLSNCWLLLWLGGNGIFRRMPHAVALTHSWVPPVT